MLRSDQPINCLTNVGAGSARCDRCDISLGTSLHKGMAVFFSTARNRSRGFLCLKCATSTKNFNGGNKKPKATIEQVEAFVNQVMHKQSQSKIMVAN